MNHTKAEILMDMTYDELIGDIEEIKEAIKIAKKYGIECFYIKELQIYLEERDRRTWHEKE